MVTFQSLLHGRIVIKYGTNALTRVAKNGYILGLNRKRIGEIAHFGRVLYDKGVEPVIVSSGALVAGMEEKKLRQRPTDLQGVIDLCTDGQRCLGNAYAAALNRYEMRLRGLLLVTYENFRTEKARENIRQRVERGFAERKIAVFNANDVVTNQELANRRYGFTDNDPLAAYVAVACKANSLVIVSEEGNLGSGGGGSKVKAFRYAEKHGIQTNRGVLITHRNIEEILEAMTHGTNNMGRL